MQGWAAAGQQILGSPSHMAQLCSKLSDKINDSLKHIFNNTLLLQWHVAHRLPIIWCCCVELSDREPVEDPTQPALPAPEGCRRDTSVYCITRATAVSLSCSKRSSFYDDQSAVLVRGSKSWGRRARRRTRGYITAAEWQTEWGGHKDKSKRPFRSLPFNCCAITFHAFPGSCKPGNASQHDSVNTCSCSPSAKCPCTV